MIMELILTKYPNKILMHPKIDEIHDLLWSEKSLKTSAICKHFKAPFANKNCL